PVLVVQIIYPVNGIGFEIKDVWIGTLLLAGLPEEYKPIIMGLENSGTPITGDAIKTKLLQDVKWERNVHNEGKELAFYSKSNNQQFQRMKRTKKGPRCYNCNKSGHLAADCWKRREKTSKANTAETEDLRAFYALHSTGIIDQGKWIIDSGASAHMSINRSWFCDLQKSSLQQNIVVANQERLPVKGSGNIILKTCDGKDKKDICAKEVLYVPGLSANLLSVSKIAKQGNKIIFDSDGCKILDKNSEILATGTLQKDTYRLVKPKEHAHALHSTQSIDARIWHRRLGHMNPEYMVQLRDHSATGNNFKGSKQQVCVACAKGKQAKQKFDKQGKRAEGLLDLIHSDLCGPMENKSIGGTRYMLTFIDDHSRKVFVYFLVSKDEVPNRFEEFKTYIERQMNRPIKCLRTDNGTEYVNQRMEQILRKNGIRHQTSIPYNPQQNGTAERMNRTLVEKAKCMLADAGLEKKFWAEAIATAAYIIDRAPNKILNNCTPEEIWTGRKPNLSHLRIFGCKAFSLIPTQQRKKWDVKTKECILLGYCQDSKGYRLWDSQTQKVIRSRDVNFVELPDLKFTPDVELTKPTISIPILSDLDTEDTPSSEGSHQQYKLNKTAPKKNKALKKKKNNQDTTFEDQIGQESPEI
ncbi:retrovirus-related pol polyprotein from transposon tnt 1-94, partial [Lasius niger]